MRLLMKLSTLPCRRASYVVMFIKNLSMIVLWYCTAKTYSSNFARTITPNNLTFPVLTTRGRRITQVRVVRDQKDQVSPTEQAEEGQRQAGPLLLPLPADRREADTHHGNSGSPSEQPSHY